MLVAGGMAPGELMEVCGLDPAGLDLVKSGYNPDQPRVPAGNPDGGQWTSTQTSASEVDRIDFAVGSVKFEVVPGFPSDAVAVTTPDGKTIPDKASKTKKPMAPPHANFREVYAAGRAIASLSLPEQYGFGRGA